MPRAHIPLLLLVGLALTQAAPAQTRYLVFSRTTGFRHESIPAGLAALQSMADAQAWSMTATEDPGYFIDDSLATFDAVVFLNTTGDVLDAAQQEAFERYIRAGGGFAGIHAAADTEYDWPWYGALVGAYFASHPDIQAGEIVVADRTHPSTSGLPDRWSRTDEWYNYQINPRGDVHVLAMLQEDSYAGGSMGYDHPIAWCQTFQGGRSWYTGGGHTPEAFAEPAFLEHLRGGLQYAAGVVGGDCGPTQRGRMIKRVLDASVDSPMELAVAPDGAVFFIERPGRLKRYDPVAASTSVVAQLDVSTVQEDGLLGITLDPAFAENGWIYLFYSPAGPDEIQRVSRFTWTGTAFDAGSERILLTIPTQRAECCHSAGSLTFGPDGSLYISVGDNTNPFASNGFAPLDGRPDRAAWDARRSAGNTNDLRGKVLRIRPTPDGGYTIPDGNLFAPDDTTGRPEIYAMGMRNPFRISVDADTGWLYWGDVGPDAGEPNPARGPQGYDEWNQARGAGNFGWPFCIADNRPYSDYDFETGALGGPFDCAAPGNLSPNNTGARTLPPAQPAWIWYPYGPDAAFASVSGEGGGRTAMAGPVIGNGNGERSNLALPRYYDGALLIYEWSRNWIKEVRMDAAGDILAILPFADNVPVSSPIDLEIGPDGALYLLEWGNIFWGGGPDATLSRLEYNALGNRPPIARLTATGATGPAPLTVTFLAAGSFDPDFAGDLSYAWDLDGQPGTDAVGETATYTYGQAGTYTARLSVTDAQGLAATAERVILVEEPVPAAFVFDPPYPNPASGRAELTFGLPSESDVRVEVYDALGRRQAVVLDERRAAGVQRVGVDVAGWRSGLYVVRVTAERGSLVRKLIVVR
ncbi:MAG: ThuA domain-containing protein [Rhodothermales bacterium]